MRYLPVIGASNITTRLFSCMRLYAIPFGFASQSPLMQTAVASLCTPPASFASFASSSYDSTAIDAAPAGSTILYPLTVTDVRDTES